MIEGHVFVGSECGDGPTYILYRSLTEEIICGEVRTLAYNVSNRAVFNENVVNYHPVFEFEMIATDWKFESPRRHLVSFARLEVRLIISLLLSCPSLCLCLSLTLDQLVRCAYIWVVEPFMDSIALPLRKEVVRVDVSDHRYTNKLLFSRNRGWRFDPTCR